MLDKWGNAWFILRTKHAFYALTRVFTVTANISRMSGTVNLRYYFVVDGNLRQQSLRI